MTNDSHFEITFSMIVELCCLACFLYDSAAHVVATRVFIINYRIS